MAVYDEWKQLARDNIFHAFDRFWLTPHDRYTHQRLSALKHVCDEIDWRNGDDVFKNKYKQLLKEAFKW